MAEPRIDEALMDRLRANVLQELNIGRRLLPLSEIKRVCEVMIGHARACKVDVFILDGTNLTEEGGLLIANVLRAGVRLKALGCVISSV